ncbi:MULTISPECIES: CRISPR-associated helicase Cas3' [unclassified Corynebacterium]|uniref:CRISPR-associated helicase Cas3' n=1 Tax=unclassified Corynebacterium TaxID=2624378 RepID=UPI001EF470C1|nr:MULTISPECIES: CRISPR-associated helicase Cas3' [unclassified Corynebacterium]MCG7258835.1 CRISPR-associated helicase Cas3' [Corynebacterium sp. ACRQK]MCG7263225.1 CRISPR-associated helicase Cas3' [Corynebacterium sp. ACRQL]
MTDPHSAPLFDLDSWNGVVDSFSPTASAFLAKSGDEHGPMSLVQHMVDSGAVATYLWDSWLSPQIKDFLSRSTRLSPEHIRSLTVFLVSAHDCGKLSAPFIRKLRSPETNAPLLYTLEDAGIPIPDLTPDEDVASLAHPLYSRELLKRWLKTHGLKAPVALSLTQTVEAHHGWLTTAGRKAATTFVNNYPPEWLSAVNEILDAFAATTNVQLALDAVEGKPPTIAIQIITGFTVMCDWLASNTDFFPLRFSGSQADRIKLGMAKAKFDLHTEFKHFSEDPAQVAENYRASFSWPESATPRPVQTAIAELLSSKPPGPALLIIEAPTGEGKTEGALQAALLFAQHNRASGAILAAPTMATANGLFKRFSRWVENITESSAVSSLYLAHSKNRLNKDYRKLRYRDIGEDCAGHGSVIATDWLSGRKNGLLSNFVVGTIDQVLMMALQIRHSMLRHLALAGKVVIFDEVHAYSTYTNEYLAETLRWLAAYGVPVILLSATLPTSRKEELVAAYGGQIGAENLPLAGEGYPLLTLVSEEGIREQAVAPRPDDMHAKVEIVDNSVKELTQLVTELCSDGGVVLVICNTIKRAQESFAALDSVFPGEVRLHHSAFTSLDRARHEEELLNELGPTSHRKHGRPTLRIVCGTQTLEQSLDIDADALITDIAPMDLIIQRAGRLHRHRRPDSDRPEKLRDARIYIRGVEETTPVPVWDSGTEYIYDDALLLTTYQLLSTEVVDKGFRRPSDVPELVQRAYDLDADHNFPETWAARWEESKTSSRGKDDSDKSRSKVFRIPSPDETGKRLDSLFEMLVRDHSEEEIKATASVRDADNSIEVIPIVDDEYGYRPLPVPGNEQSECVVEDTTIPNFDTAFQLAASTVRLPTMFTRSDKVWDRTVDALEDQTPEGWKDHYLLRGQVALRLDQNLEASLADVKISYSELLGLRTEGFPGSRKGA